MPPLHTTTLREKTFHAQTVHKARGKPAMADESGMSDVTERLAMLEARVAELESSSHPVGGPPAVGDLHPVGGAPHPGGPDAAAPAAPATPEPPADDPFWALTSLKDRLPAPGGVLLTGAVDVGAGHLEYQWARPTEHLLETDWTQHAESIAALGHPLRMAMLRRLLDGEHTVAQLVDELELGSTGVAYHHVSARQTGGWVVTPRRGSWALPAPRIVPLLTILIALEKG